MPGMMDSPSVAWLATAPEAIGPTQLSRGTERGTAADEFPTERFSVRLVDALGKAQQPASYTQASYLSESRRSFSGADGVGETAHASASCQCGYVT